MTRILLTSVLVVRQNIGILKDYGAFSLLAFLLLGNTLCLVQVGGFGTHKHCVVRINIPYSITRMCNVRAKKVGNVIVAFDILTRMTNQDQLT